MVDGGGGTELDPVGQATVVVAQPDGEFRQGVHRLRLARRAEIVDAGRHHGDADDTVQAVIEGGADDDIGVLVRPLPESGWQLH